MADNTVMRVELICLNFKDWFRQNLVVFKLCICIFMSKQESKKWVRAMEWICTREFSLHSLLLALLSVQSLHHCSSCGFTTGNTRTNPTRKMLRAQVLLQLCFKVCWYLQTIVHCAFKKIV